MTMKPGLYVIVMKPSALNKEFALQVAAVVGSLMKEVEDAGGC
jgi:hypothetical protein